MTTETPADQTIPCGHCGTAVRESVSGTCWVDDTGSDVCRSAATSHEPAAVAAVNGAALDPERVDRALRTVLAHLDYDLHKALEHDEETGEDTYHETVAAFIAAYQGAGRG